MPSHKNARAFYECSDADTLRPDEASAGRISVIREEKVRRKKRIPLILVKIAGLLVNPWKTKVLLAISDILGSVGGMFFGFLVGKYVINAAGSTINNYLAPIISYSILMLSFIYLNRGYGRLKDRRPEEDLRSVVIGCSWALFSMIALNFILFKDISFSRYILIVGYLASLFLVILFRFSLRQLLNILWSYGLAQENVIIAGDSANNVRWLTSHLHIQRYRGFNILGYMAQKPSEDFHYGFKYLGGFNKLAATAQQQRVDKVFFAFQGYSDQRHKTLMSRLEECSALGIPVMIISHVFNDFFFSLTMDGYSSVFVLDCKEPAYARPLYCLLKRSIDISGSLLMLFVCLPLWLLAALCIKLQDGGPILFKHNLVGKDGKIFRLLKFRTMVMGAHEILANNPELFEQFRKNYKLANDPRITWIGKFLRKYSLDEIPQFINVLKGDMSLVGPRPIKAEEADLFGKFRFERMKIRPGLTGFWQVNGRCATSYEDRVLMDKFYMYKCSVWMDFYILLKTPVAVLKAEGAE
jgi:exopolysaccharide biosynthesis polyprenyl glycosylphosphotransferase